MNDYFLIWTADGTYIEQFTTIMQLKTRLDDLKFQYSDITYKIIYGYEIFKFYNIS